MKNSAFETGLLSGILSAAAAGHDKTASRADVYEVVSEALGGDVSGQRDLESLLPGPGELEKALLFLEEKFGVVLDDKTMFRLFAHGTVDDLVGAIDSRLSKTASYSHRSYMMKREQHKARSRSYRLSHATQIRRKARAYRRKVKRRMIRPRRRIGSSSAGFQFVMR